MIKTETIGMLDIAKINPVIKLDKDIKTNSFITVDGATYLVANTITGDELYKEDVAIAAGEFINGYDVEPWKGQKLVVDGKHITGGVEGVDVGDVLVVAEDGTLKTGEATGVHFVVTDKGCALTEAAVKVKVAIA